MFNIEQFSSDPNAKTLAYFSKNPNVRINRELIDKIKLISKQIGFENIRLCLHNSPASDFHNMVIMEYENSRYYRPHYHSEKEETLQIIEGEAYVFCFGKDGGIENRFLLSNQHDLIVRIGVGQVHTLIPKTSNVIYHETKKGPFKNDGDSLFPSWCPDGNDKKEAQNYIKNLMEQFPK